VDTYALRVILETEALRQSIPLLDADDIALARGYIQQLKTKAATPRSAASTGCSTCSAARREPEAAAPD
jgi:hypothetical protein